MPRTKNSNFTGSRPALVEPDAPTFKRVMQNVFGDLALIFDKLTGENAEANTVNHSGGVRGARLGMPYINQGCPDARGYPLASLFVETPAASGHASLGETLIFAVPIFIPTGETDLVIEIYGEALGVYPWRYELTQSTTITTPIVQAPLELSGDNPGNQRLHAQVTHADIDGGLRLLLIYADTSEQLTEYSAGGTRLWSLVVAPMRFGNTEGIPAYSPTNQWAAVTEPAAAEGTAFTSGFDALFVDEYPLHSWLTAKAARNIAGLLEYVTGFPAFGNVSYTHVDHDGAGLPDDVNPARSRFHAGTRSLYASEPLPALPVFSEALGAFRTSGDWAVGDGTGATAEPPLAGMLGWYAPWPVATTSQNVTSVRLMMPDFPTGASSNLKLAILVGTGDSGAMANWTTTIANGVDSDGGTPTVVTGSSSRLALYTGTALDFSPDAVDTFTLRTSRSGARSKVEEICLLGWCLYFEP